MRAWRSRICRASPPDAGPQEHRPQDRAFHRMPLKDFKRLRDLPVSRLVPSRVVITGARRASAGNRSCPTWRAARTAAAGSVVYSRTYRCQGTRRAPRPYFSRVATTGGCAATRSEGRSPIQAPDTGATGRPNAGISRRTSVPPAVTGQPDDAVADVALRLAAAAMILEG
jgi:hypothetical protein